MNSDEGKIGFSLELDDAKLKRQIADSGKQFQQLADQVESDGARMDNAISGIGSAVTSLGLAWSMQSFAKEVANVRGEFQKLQVAMETMLQSKSKAEALMAQMVQTAATTPFGLQEVAGGAKQLLAYGMEAEKVNETLIRLGDIAAGLSIPLGDLVYLYGTTMTQGRLYTQDFNQFVGRGIPLVSELAKQFGVAENKVKGLVEEGKVGFPEIQKVIENLTNAGGTFGGLMEKQSQTISGQISNIEDSFDMMFNEIGQNNEGIINDALSATSFLVENYKQVAEAIGTLVAAYGVYKATLMTMTAYTNAAYSYEIAQLKAVLAEKGAEIDADLATAVSKGRMSAARAQEVQALRAELAAKIENAKAIAIEAEAEAGSATRKRMLAQLAYQKARAEVEAKQEEIFAMEGLYAHETAETLQKEKDVLVTKMHAAQERLDAAAKIENAAKTKAATAAQTVNTLSTQRDTVAKKLNVTHTKLLTLANNALTKALHALKAAWATNPIGLILMGVTMVAGALMTMGDAMESASEEVTRFGESAVKTMSNVDTLMAVINNTSQKSKVHNDAVDELCKIYEEFGIKIDEERDKLEQLNEMREEVIRLIKEEGEERQKANLIQSYEDAIGKSTQKMKDELLTALQNAEWDGSGLFDDWDADEYKERAEELATIIGSIIESEGEELAKLSGDAYEAKLKQINQRIEQAYKDLGLNITKEFMAADGQTLLNLGTDVNEVGILEDYVDKIKNIVRHREDLINSYQKSREGAEEEAEAVDYTTLSFEKLFDAAYHADDKITETKTNLQMLGGFTAKPLIDTSSLDNAINQTNSLINNLQFINGQPVMTFNPAGFQIPTLQLPDWDPFGMKNQRFGLSIDFPTSFTNTGNSEIVKAQNELENRLITAMKTRKGTSDLLKEVNSALDTAESGSDDEKRLIALQKRLNAQKKKFDQAEGKNTHTESAEERRARIEKAELDTQRLLEESARAREQLQRDLALQAEQNSINLEENASERRRRQLELDQAKEQDQLKRQQETAVKAEIARQKSYFDAVENAKAARNKKYVKKNFTEDDIDQTEIDAILAQYQTLFEQLEQQQQRSRIAMVRDEFDSMRDYLKNYGSYQEQKLAIAEEYAKKIKEAQTEGERLSLQKERDTQLSNIEAQELKANIDWTAVFGEFGSMFKDIIAPALEDTKRYMQTDEFKNSDAASQKAIIDAVQQMEESLGGADKVSFKKLGTEITNYQKALRKLREAQEDYARVNTELQQAQQAYTDALREGTEEQQAQAKTALDAAQANADAASQNIATLQTSVNEARQAITDTATTLKTSMEGTISGLQKLTSGSLKGAYDGLIQFGTSAKELSKLGKLGDVMGKVADTLKDVPIIGWIASIIDIFKDGLSVVIGGLLDAIFNAVSGIIGDILNLKDGLFRTIGESLYKGILGIFKSILTFGGLWDWWGNGESDKNLERDIERLTEVNKLLQNAIEELTEKLNDSAMTDAADLYQQQKKLLDESEANTRELMRRSGAAYSNGFLGIGGHRSSNKKINDGMSGNDWKRISDIVGKTVNGADDFWNLTSEQMRKLATEAPDLYAKIKDLANDGYKDAAQFMDDYIEYAKQREELEKAYYEKLTNFSFDSLRSEFKNALTDMEMTASDFANNFNKMLIDSIAEALMTNKYDPMIKALYEKWAKYMENDGMLDDDEIADIQKDRDAIYKSMQGDRQFLETLSTGESASQESTKKGFATASQDSIDELNGRFTAIQMDTSAIRETLAGINAAMMSMSFTSDEIRRHTDEIRNISLIAIDYLETISKNTNELYEMNDRLGKIEKNTRKL